MFGKSRNFALLLAAAGLTASCASQPRPAEPPGNGSYRASPSPAVRPAMSAADYVERAGSIDLFVIEASELARSRSSMRKIADVAERLIALHKRTSSELSLAGRRLNLLPSATLDAKRQAMLDRLRGAPDIEREYAAQMKAVHSDAYALHSAYAARGSSPTLRPVAAAIAPEMQQALRLLSYL